MNQSKEIIKTWEKEFDERFCELVGAPPVSENGRYLLRDTIIPSDIKSFIRSLLTKEKELQKQELVEKIEGMKKDVYSKEQGHLCFSAYNQALQDILQIIKQS